MDTLAGEDASHTENILRLIYYEQCKINIPFAVIFVQRKRRWINKYKNDFLYSEAYSEFNNQVNLFYKHANPIRDSRCLNDAKPKPKQSNKLTWLSVLAYVNMYWLKIYYYMVWKNYINSKNSSMYSSRVCLI